MAKRILRRARFRFGLKAVFLLLTVAAVVLGWQAYRAARREAAAMIRDRGGSIQFESAGPAWLAQILSHDLTSRAVRVSILAPRAAELVPYLCKLRSLHEIEFGSSEDSRSIHDWMKVPEFFAFREAILRLSDELPSTKLTFRIPTCYPMDSEWAQVRTDLELSDRTLPAGLEGEWLSIWFVATTDGGYLDLIAAELDDGTNRLYLLREGELVDTLSLTGGPSAWRLTDVNRDHCADLEGSCFAAINNR